MTLKQAADYALRSPETPEVTEAPPAYPAGLSAREVDVLKLVASGLTNAQIATELFISPNTVNRHLNSIYLADNSIFSNAGLGINLLGGFENTAGVTANDPGDVDTGPNNLQNFPVLTSARTVSGMTTITGKLSSTPNSGHNVQFFSNPSGGEGKKFIGERGFVTTDGSGNATFTFSPANPVPAGQTITATVLNQSLSTSEFSAPRKVTS